MRGYAPWSLVLLAACSSAPAPSAPEPRIEPWREAMVEVEPDWSQRNDPTYLKRAIDGYEAIVSEFPDAVPVLVRLARAYHAAARAFPEPDGPFGSATDSAEAGVDRAENALELEPGLVPQLNQGRSLEAIFADPTTDLGNEPVYWYCQNLLAFAQEGGMPTLLFYRRRLAACFARLCRLAPDLDGGGPARGQGALLALLPAHAGRDLEGSRASFEATGGPEASLWNPVLRAETYAVAIEATEEARDLLERALVDEPSAPDQLLAQARARWLLGRFAPRSGDEVEGQAEDSAADGESAEVPAP